MLLKVCAKKSNDYYIQTEGVVVYPSVILKTWFDIYILTLINPFFISTTNSFVHVDVQGTAQVIHFQYKFLQIALETKKLIQIYHFP